MPRDSWVARAASATAVAAYLSIAYSWFASGLRDSEAPLVFSASKLVLPAAVLVTCLVLRTRLRGARRVFAEAADARWAVGLFLVAVASRLVLLRGAHGLFSSDAAAQGVMALHILEGKHHPVLLYNLSYIGSPKAHLTALLALGFGDPVLSFALAGILMYALFVVAVFTLAREMLPRRESVLAAGYAIASPGFLTAWGATNDGSYVDVLALGTLSMVLGARVLKGEEGGARRAFWMGVLGGIGFWVHILATYYLFAALFVFAGAGRGRKTLPLLFWFLLGFVVGDFPVILWNAHHDWQSFQWWTHEQSAVSERVVRGASQLKATLSTAFPVLSGYWPVAEPPWPAPLWRLLLTPLVPGAAFGFALRSRASLRPLLKARLTPEAFLLLYGVIVVSIFSMSSFGWLAEEPRYLLFLFSVIPIWVAAALGSFGRVTAYALSACLLAVHLQGSVRFVSQALVNAPENRRFLSELAALGVRYARTDYFISYKYNFLSGEKIVFTSELGPAQTEWYMTYRSEAAAAPRVALIPRSFHMARRIARRLDALGIRYSRRDLLYPVIYDLSENVSMDALR